MIASYINLQLPIIVILTKMIISNMHHYIESITINDFEDCVTQSCTSFLIQDTDTYNTLTIYLLLIFISELLEYYIVKYVVLSIVCIICCYIFAFLINYLLSIDKSQKKTCIIV